MPGLGGLREYVEVTREQQHDRTAARLVQCRPVAEGSRLTAAQGGGQWAADVGEVGRPR